MAEDNLQIIKRALEREKKARKAAEKILEEKSLELYKTSEKLQELLNEKSTQLQGIFENILDAYVVIDINGNVLKFNEAATKLFGYNIDDESLSVLKLIYKDDYEYAMTSFSELLEKGYFKDYEARIYTKNKEVRWVHINASVIKEKDGTVIAAQGIVRDITDQKISKERLIQSESRLSSLILNLDSGVLLEDENRKIVLTNDKFCELFGIPASPEQLIGQDCSQAAESTKELFTEEDAFVKKIDLLLKNKMIVLGEELIMKNGTVLERDFIPITKDNVYRGHLWAYRDVTLKRNYRQSLESQKQKYGSIIANMNLGLVELNNEDEILMINQSFSQMSGFLEEEAIGKKLNDLIEVQSHIYSNQDSRSENKNHLSESIEQQVKIRSGEKRYWLISSAPNYDLTGTQVGSIRIYLDITDLKKLELQKEKLLTKLKKSNDELEEYAHVVSHDLKSPLRSINALVNCLKEDNKDKLDSQSLHNFSLIETTTERMEQLISDVLDYSKVGSGQSDFSQVDCNTLIDNIIGMLLIPDKIEIKLLNPLPVVRGDKIKLQQLFQNLLSNAIKFIDKEKGLIEIDAIEMPGYFQFSVKDNGIGIEKQFHEKIFKIFNSLDESKDSSGIGLSIVKKIVNIHDGSIWLESEPGKGTTFFFTLKK